MISAPMIARGIAFCGLRTSSLAVATASRPIYEKKMTPAAPLIPDACAKKFSKWSALNAENPMTMNIASTPSLMHTMIALIVADSEAPRMRSSMHRSTSTTAGRLTMPPVATPSSPGTNEADSS